MFIFCISCFSLEANAIGEIIIYFKELIRNVETGKSKICRPGWQAGNDKLDRVSML